MTEYTCDPETEYKLTGEFVENDFIRVEFECRMTSGKIINQTCTISNKGVEFEAQSDGEVEILFPLFDFDGLNSTEITVSEKGATVSYKGFECVYLTDGTIKVRNEIYANRNGHYR